MYIGGSDWRNLAERRRRRRCRRTRAGERAHAQAAGSSEVWSVRPRERGRSPARVPVEGGRKEGREGVRPEATQVLHISCAASLWQTVGMGCEKHNSHVAFMGSFGKISLRGENSLH